MANTEHVHQWADTYPELGTGTLSVEPYVSDSHHRLERDRIFTRTWLYAGRVDDVKDRGDFFVKDFPNCGVSVLIVRAGDGTIGAFHNVCTHRCTTLVSECAGSKRSFACPFHGWTFRLDGSLGGVPEEGQFFGLKKSQLGLRRVALEEWRGFLFVNLDTEPRESLEGFLGGTLDLPIADYPYFDGEHESWSWRVDLATNWKVALDAFSEGYHAPFVHSQTVKNIASGADNRSTRPLDIRIYGLHHLMTIYGNPDYRPGPIGAAAFAAAPLQTRFRDAEVMKNLPAGVNPCGTDRWGFDQYFIFPNILVSIFGEWWHVHEFIPTAVDRTVWQLRVFFPKATSFSERFAQDYTRALLKDNMLEDLGTVEASFAGMRSGAIPAFVLQDDEVLIRHNRAGQDAMIAGTAYPTTGERP